MSLKSITIDHRGVPTCEFQHLLISACQNVNLVRLTLAHLPNTQGLLSQYTVAILASQVRYLRIESDQVGVHAAVVRNLSEADSGCSLASLELAGYDAQALQLDVDGAQRLRDFCLDLANLAYLSGIVAISIPDLRVPLDFFQAAAAWLKAAALEPSNQSLLVFDHPGIDLGPELTDHFKRLTHSNRARFAFPDGFSNSAAESFGRQRIYAQGIGPQIAKYLIPESGLRQDELTLALINTTSYRTAVTARSEEFRNELFKLIDTHQTGAIHTLRQMMLEAHMGLTDEHLEQVWQCARERGVTLPDLPVQWLPPKREQPRLEPSSPNAGAPEF